jgi:uncharacterized phage-associated protein
MRISFQFDLGKAVQAMAYLVRELTRVDKAKLMKLMYVADRDHFIEHGYPITGDEQVAMKYGPLPSACLDALDGNPRDAKARVFAYLQIEDTTVSLRKDPGDDRLAESEKAMLQRVAGQHRDKSTWALGRETHAYPEYQHTYREGTSTPIPWEVILRHYGGAAAFSKGRPVVSPEMAAHMTSPFSQPEPDL